MFKYFCSHQIFRTDARAWGSRVLGEPGGTLGLGLLPWWAQLDFGFSGGVSVLMSMASAWGPDSWSLSRSHWLEERIFSFKLGSVLICKALALTKLHWIQPEKYNTQPCRVLGCISVNEKGAGLEVVSSFRCTFCSPPLGVALFRTKFNFCLFFATQKEIVAWMCFPLKKKY